MAIAMSLKWWVPLSAPFFVRACVFMCEREPIPDLVSISVAKFLPPQPPPTHPTIRPHFLMFTTSPTVVAFIFAGEF